MIITIFTSSTLLSLLRGFVQEVSSLIVWIAAIYISFLFFDTAAVAFPTHWSDEVKNIFGFFAVLFSILLVSKIIVLSLKETISFLGVSQIDRLFGAIFGALRGSFIIIVLAILGAMTALPKEDAWSQSASKPFLEVSIRCSLPLLPDFFRSKIDLPSENNIENINLCAQFLG